MKIMRYIALIFVAGAGQIFSIRAADWPTFRGNPERTGYYADPAGYPSGPPSWTTKLGCEIVSSPCVKDNILYVGGRDSCIYALDCGTGGVRWKRKTGGWVDAGPMIDGDRLIVGSRDSTIYSLDKSTGEVRGRWAAGLQLSSPVRAVDGSILCGRGLPKGGISGFAAGSSGADPVVPSWSISLPQYTYSSPAVHGQAAVIGATDGSLYGIDTNLKDTIWSLPTKGGVYLSTPAIDDTTVYFAPGDEDRSVYAVNLLTGKIIWKSDGVYPSTDIAPGLAKKQNVRLLPPLSCAKLTQLSPSDRKKMIVRLKHSGMDLPRMRAIAGAGLRKTAVSGAEGDFIPESGMKTSSVAVGSNNVFVIEKDLGYVLVNDSLVEDKQLFSLHAFDKATGTPLWNFSERRASSHLGYCSSPVVTANAVFFGWGEGRIYGLSADSGQKVWEDSLNGNIISSPAIAQSKLYVATMNGYVYAYSLSQTPPGLDFQRSTYCYPNPARHGVSHIQVFVSTNARMDLLVSNWADQPVLRASTALTAGQKYSYDWNVVAVANGVYFAVVKVTYETGKTDKKVLKIAVLN